MDYYFLFVSTLPRATTSITRHPYFVRVFIATHSQALTNAIIPLKSFPFRFLFIRFVDESNAANHICCVDLISPSVVNLAANLVLLHHASISRQFFNEFKSVTHCFQTLGSLLSDRHKSYETALEAILQHEGGSETSFQIK